MQLFFKLIFQFCLTVAILGSQLSSAAEQMVLSDKLKASWTAPVTVEVSDAQIHFLGPVTFSGPGLYCDVTSTQAVFNKQSLTLSFPEGTSISACALREPGPASTVLEFYINYFDCVGPAETFDNGMLKSCQEFSNVRIYHDGAYRSADALYFDVECYIESDTDYPYGYMAWFKTAGRVSFYAQGSVREIFLTGIYGSLTGAQPAYPGCYKYLYGQSLPYRSSINAGRRWEFLESGDLF